MKGLKQIAPGMYAGTDERTEEEKLVDKYKNLDTFSIRLRIRALKEVLRQRAEGACE